MNQSSLQMVGILLENFNIGHTLSMSHKVKYFFLQCFALMTA